SREIQYNIETYFTRFEASGQTREDARAEGRKWEAAISRQNANYQAEMAGIAKGAGVDGADIAILNARYEIAFTLFGRDAKKQEELLSVGPDGCSTFGLLPEATADGHTWLGQNWDWLEAIHGRALLLRVHRKNAPRYICLTEAGIVGGKMGVNECGIGLVENGLASEQDGANPYQKPFHVRCREVVEAERFEDALRPIVSSKRTCSANFVIGDAAGEIIDLETSPNHVSYLYPAGGVLTHSNHFLGTDHGESQMEKISPNTLYRHARLRRLLERHVGQLTIAHMSAAFADEFGSPNGICRLPDPLQIPAKRSMTVASVLIDLNARVMHVANGPPSLHRYVPFGIDG
ncbi:MAG: C45 family autoproteolytic acyltransferase/hydrolase, partial [Pseudorhodoplanes sp.]